jgi:hypothetical protein
MDVELDPPQPEPVALAVAQALAAAEHGLNPWWEAGIQEALGS